MSDTREEAIRSRAHRLWEMGGHQHGQHAEHWAQAEQEIDAGQGDEKSVATTASEMSTTDPAPGAASNLR